RDRTAPAGTGAERAGVPGPADGPGQPGAVRRAGPAGGGAQPADRAGRRGDDRRPGRLQGGQRHARARRRGRAAGPRRRAADLGLYAAKGAGKGQWRRYQSELHTAVVERLRLRAELDRAVEKDEFTVHYQPIVALGSGTAVGFEALVRWEHPERGLLAPAQF